MSRASCTRVARRARGLVGQPLCTDGTRAHLADAYTGLHEGLAPDRLLWQAMPGRVPPLTDLGRVAEIQYRKRVPRLEPSYHHPFAPHARPRLCRDAAGTLWVYAGRYVVTDHGIEDLPAGTLRHDRLPSTRPVDLVDLGRLEWLKVVRAEPGGRETERVLRFGDRGPTVAQSQGDLYVLGNRAASRTMEGHHRHTMAHRNPGTLTETGLAALQSSLMLGGTAFLTVLAAQATTRRVAWNGYAKGLAKAAGGIALATAVAALNGPPTVAAGLGVGGVIAGLMDVADQYHASSGAMTAPGGYALSAGALPNNYYPLGTQMRAA